ncbi:histone H1 [Marinilongibacter aquaticus]|uniref:histone H1 n=1 Tax=Marinilongibacter aquaticus TaxID=2975157 RepID=UPI0021BD552D|nr:histone H1 [Marinilongibacter aquaticus]UBM58270.1 histone H1 [Marinilongibacter aquaticus]
METKIQNLKTQLNELETDYEKFQKGNKSAGTRCRVTAQKMKAQLQELRVEILESKKQ